MEETSLFRQDAIVHQHKGVDGQVMLTKAPSFNKLIAIIAIMLILAIAFLSTAQFNHFETVRGILVESQSTLKVFSSKNAILKSIEVKEGDKVELGQTIAVLRSDSFRLEGGSKDEVGRTELLKQLSNYHLSKTRLSSLSELKQKSLQNDIDLTEMHLAQTVKKITLANERMELAKNRVELEEKLLETSSISVMDFYKNKSDYIRIQEQVLDLNTQRTVLIAQLKGNNTELERIPIELSDGLTSLDNDISKVKRQLIDLEAEIEWSLDAISEGVVTNILAKQGEYVLSSYPLFSLTPATSELLAELYIPSRAIGFIKLGLKVNLRFDTFPYQMYGDVFGEITEVSKVLLFPDEWPNPTQVKEPIYRIKVTLDKHTLTDGTQQVYLQSGLNVDADIVLEQQSILSYVFSPMLDIKLAFNN